MLRIDHPAYASGVLSPDNSSHAALVHDIDRYADDAGIAKRWFSAPLDHVMSPAEIEWCRTFKARRKSGETTFNLCLTGADKSAAVHSHMAAMAGVFVRNDIRARVFTVESLLALDVLPEASCLLIPNFYLGKELGVSNPKWKLDELYDLLTDRNVRDLPTVVYASDVQRLRAEYGAAFANLIASDYEEIVI
jgi:hypothetical protein